MEINMGNDPQTGSSLQHGPLDFLHRQTTAEFQRYADIEIVTTFGNMPAEYSAIRKGAGRMNRPQRAILELTGPDRLDFLNRLLTNQTYDKAVKIGLAAGKGVYAFLLNSKGRIASDVNVLELGDRTWLELDRRLLESTRQTLDKYLIGDNATLSSRAGELHEIGIYGPKAPAALNLPEMGQLDSTRLTIAGAEAVVFRDDICGSPGFHLIVPTSSAAAVWNSLELRPVGWAAFNTARIEAGRPLMGIDFDDTILPAEIGPVQLARGVSFTKGCYLGQEIVARMHARGQIAKQLVGIRMEGDALPVAGSQIYDAAANAIGGITSSTISPVLSNAAICLGYVKKAFIAAGTELSIPAEGAMRKGRVQELGFLG
jgi:folate-binding protein YgfZ